MDKLDTKIELGQTATVVIKRQNNLLPALFPDAKDTASYTGSIEKSTKYDGLDTVRISSNCQAPVHVIQFRDILSWNGSEFVYTPKAPEVKLKPQPTREVKVMGSKGEEYTVTVQPNGSKSCTCKGFGFRHTCRHVDEVK